MTTESIRIQIYDHSPRFIRRGLDRDRDRKNRLSKISPSSSPLLSTSPTVKNYKRELQNWVDDTAEESMPLEKQHIQKEILKCLKNKTEELILEDYDLRSIPPLSALKNVKKISLKNNKIEYMSPHCFNHLTQLLVLDISSNRLQTFNTNQLNDCKTLESLNLSYNQLSQENLLLNLTNFQHLKELKLTGNPILNLEKLDFSHCQKLCVLQLNSLQIADIECLDLSNCCYLNQLDLSFNNLKHLNCILPKNAKQPLQINLSWNDVNDQEIKELLEKNSMIKIKTHINS